MRQPTRVMRLSEVATIMKLTGTVPGSPPAPVTPRSTSPTRTVIAHTPVPVASGEIGRSQTAASSQARTREATNGHAVVISPSGSKL